jgi:hypothetical protein
MNLICVQSNIESVGVLIHLELCDDVQFGGVIH